VKKTGDSIEIQVLTVTTIIVLDVFVAAMPFFQMVVSRIVDGSVEVGVWMWVSRWISRK
jgi:hypothetical protein